MSYVLGPSVEGLNVLHRMSGGHTESMFTSQGLPAKPSAHINVSQQQPWDSRNKYLDKKPFTKTQMPFNRGCVPSRISQLPKDCVPNAACLRAMSGESISS